MTLARRRVAPQPIRFPQSEDGLHMAISQWLRWNVAPPGERSDAGVIWWSIEHRNAKSSIEGANRKVRGVIAGIPDTQFFWPEGEGSRCGLIELKFGKGTRSDEQKALHGVLAASGVLVATCYSLIEVVEQLAAWSVPVPSWSTSRQVICPTLISQVLLTPSRGLRRNAA